MGTGPAHVEEWDEAKAKSEIARLVEDYERSKSDGRLSRFSEEETKKDFILPLFRALGWRVDSSEVSAEERILRGRADYGFKIGGVTKFYVEAKPLSKDIWERGNLQQVIDYSYAKGVPWAVLTNFARTVVLYSEAKDPNPFNSGFLDLAADKYLAEFDRLRLLSRLAVANNELDSKAEAFGRKPKKQPIDKQLLKDLNSFRLDLAKDIRRLNGDRFQEADEALEETVQRILDRLIFIRVAEDRGLEDKQLSLLSKGPESTAAKRLRELFRRYDQNFDSKLFQPHAADDVRVEGEVLQRILRGLHETEDGAIRYDFGAIDADVLGVMYEQYLGLVLRQTPKRAKLADGKVNRKEQGIYYTPTWVVDYIVRFSIEEALKRKGARPEKLRVLDPACGSGTFLLRAFDHLMRARNPTGASVQARFDPEASERLVGLRTSVLTENLFGVDLDARAVEIAQLNLMIRAAESRHRLPTLERNVRVGNSVIADPAVDTRALDWSNAFPEAMREGGFDVVVGNPPWSAKIPNQVKSTVAEKWDLSAKNLNLCTLFVLQGLSLTREGGAFGFLLPKVVLKNDTYSRMREKLLSSFDLVRIIDFGKFPGVASDSVSVVVRKARPGTETKVSEARERQLISRSAIPQSVFRHAPTYVLTIGATPEALAVIEKVRESSRPLGEVFAISRGIELGQKSQLQRCPKCGSYSETGAKYYGPSIRICQSCGATLPKDNLELLAISSTEPDGLHRRRCVAGRQIRRYGIEGSYYIPDFVKGVDFKEEVTKPPAIFLKRIATRPEAVVSTDDLLAFNTVYSLRPRDLPGDVDLAATVGLLNSSLFAYYLEKTYNVGMKLTTQITIETLSRLPLRRIERTALDLIAKQASMLSHLASEIIKSGPPKTDRRRVLEAEFRAADARMDDIVFRAYELSPDEAALVAGEVRGSSSS